MSVGHNGARRLASFSALSRDSICNSCLNRLSHQVSRRHASAAVAVAEAPSHTSSSTSSSQPVAATGPRKAFRLSCSPVISRPPLLTRELTSFEKAFYLYQKRLNERLVLPFTRYFYYKQGTPADIEWKRKYKVRQVAARDVGLYNAYAEDGWNDEVLVGSKLGEPEDIVNKLIRDAEGKPIIETEADNASEGKSADANAEGPRKPLVEIEVPRPLPRQTQADLSNDLKSLNRKLDQTVYLLVKNKAGEWRFPEDRVYGRENLNQAAERILIQAGGINMNTWVVANHPVGHYIGTFSKPQVTTVQPNRLVSTSKESFELEEHGEKVFFMKTRIMAGQVDLTKNEYGDKDFEWLTKAEIQAKVSEPYWRYIKNMLVDR